jgi:hypothetical protein
MKAVGTLRFAHRTGRGQFAPLYCLKDDVPFPPQAGISLSHAPA